MLCSRKVTPVMLSDTVIYYGSISLIFTFLVHIAIFAQNLTIIHFYMYFLHTIHILKCFFAFNLAVTSSSFKFLHIQYLDKCT